MPMRPRRHQSLVACAALALLLGGTISACSGSVVVVKCEGGLQSCDGECTDVTNDNGNCGICGNQCGDDAVCSEGSCFAGDCPPPEVTCEGECADLFHDHDHCGQCGVDCGALFCENANCVTSCSPNLTPCDGSCADTQGDPDNCGNCGVECPGVCVSGFCADSCNPGLEDCFGFCVDTNTDQLNCGFCGHSCALSEGCIDGDCDAAACPPDLTSCFGECVETLTDVANCGFCGNFCGPDAFCDNGMCSNLSTCDDPVCGICEVAFLPSTVPFSVTGNTSFTSDFFTPPCTGTAANEALHVFTAPSDGFYSFDAIGTEFDSVLAMLDPQSCGVIDCSDDVVGSAAQIVTFLAEGESVFIVMDGFDNGTYQLNVSEGDEPCNDVCGSCGVIDLPPGTPQTFQGSTSGLPDLWFPSCAFDSAGEQVHRFTAGVASSYTFSTAGSGFDTLLTVLDPFSCSELGCSDDFGGFSTSSVTVPLTVGQEVLVSVDGNGVSGFYDLSISSMVAPMCPTSPLGSSLPITVSGSTSTAGSSFSPTCSPGTAPEHTFSFTAPLSKQYIIDTVGSSYDTVLHVLDGVCTGPTIACDDDGGGGTASLVTPFLNAGQTVTIIVDGFGGGAGSYVLHVQ